ncbi:penicillin-binding protein 1A [Kangiella sediminilitoris]|uniref:penicillin-binding protein 1A n=1 Tax=Kangiella sediminilitoris TaxID=1144748 RepID=UPI001E28AF10|nr:penicillin-binding protein 1A [Kangiella sediminilitoris]
MSFITIFVIMTVIGAFLYATPQVPEIDSLKNVKLQTPMRIFSADGKIIGEFGDVRREPVEFAQIPKNFINALVATEDQRFYEHSGVDLKGLLRVMKVAATTGEFSEGASTLTMQTARNMFLTRDQRLKRKLIEMFLAISMEQELSKEEILELYTNKVHFSHRAYGLAAAAEVYYGKQLNELTLSEAAMMAGLLKGESAYNPISHPDRAIGRRNLVLSRMLDEGYIEEEAYELAVETPLTAKKHSADLDVEAPYVAEMVRLDVINRFGRDIAYNHGLDIVTTIDSEHQRYANEALREGLITYDKRHGYKGPEAQIGDFAQKNTRELLQLLESTPEIGGLEPAIVMQVNEKSLKVLNSKGQEITIEWEGLEWAAKFITDTSVGEKPNSAGEVAAPGDVIRIRPIGENKWALSQLPEASAAFVSLHSKDGGITSLVGGFDYLSNKFNLVTQARRQPGSNIKPFIYAAAFSKGFTPASLVNDAPYVKVNNEIDEVWRPQNDNLKYNGPTRLRVGLKRSINTISTRLINSITPAYAEKFLVNIGLPDEHMDPYQSLALGTASFTPMEMATAYAVLANGGYQVEPYYIEKITTSYGDILYEATPKVVCDECEQIKINNQIREAKYSPEIRNYPQLPLPENKIAQQVIDPRDAFILYDMMKDVIHSGTATTQLRRRNSPLLERNDLAGKTGTANDYKDAWFSGFNDRLVASAWMGFSDHRRSLGRYEYGGKAALPIWAEFMEKALNGVPEQEIIQPPGVVSAKIDPETGKLAALGQQNAIFEYFRDDNVPSEVSQASDDFGQLYTEGLDNSEQEQSAPEQLEQEELDQLIQSLQDDPENLEMEQEPIEREEQEEPPEPGSIF